MSSISFCFVVYAKSKYDLTLFALSILFLFDMSKEFFKNLLASSLFISSASGFLF
jgi:hypothetical protein